MNNAYHIIGGKKIKGELEPSGAKNAALKLVIAGLLFDKPVVLKNIPHIGDVMTLINLIKDLGGSINFLKKNVLQINGSSLIKNKVDLFFGSKVRVSFLLFAPLLYRFGRCYIPNPGGCRIGARPIDRIIEGMKSLGIEVSYSSETGFYQAKMIKKPKGYYCFPKPSHTGTELLILISVLSDGNQIIIDNAALEPEIDDLINFLNLAGGKIRREGKKIIVNGVKKLKLSSPYALIKDRNEVVTYITLALATKGEIYIKNFNPDLIESFIEKIKATGNPFKKLKNNLLYFQAKNKFKAVSVETQPHPGFMTDWQPNWAVLMTQAQGTALIHERVFENRFSYVDELRKLGVKIALYQPKVTNPEKFYFFNYQPTSQYFQGIKITGPQKLHGGVIKIADLRAGASLAVAALVAEGESIINNIETLERGYEDFEKKIRSLGGVIKKIKYE